ncbi:MAG: ATP-grasp domain-containing protein [Duganella sp.]
MQSNSQGKSASVRRVWFNRAFSSVYTAISLIRDADRAQRYHLIYSHVAPAPAGQAAHQFELEPAGLKGDDYVDWCLDFCRLHGVQILVAGKEARLISAASGRFADVGARVLCAGSADTLQLLHDKARFYATVDCPQAPPPATVAVHTLAEFDAAYAQLRGRHPKLCIKPSQSIYGLGFAVIDEQRSCAELLIAGVQYHIGLADLRAGLALLPEFRTMLVMEYLEGREYSVDCVGDHGNLVVAVPRKKPQSSGTAQRIDLHADILAACATLASSYGLNGCFNVQFRETGERPRLLEINPRMSGGISMACAAGPNLPYLALAGFDQGFDQVEIAPVRDGARVTEVSIALEL